MKVQKYCIYKILQKKPQVSGEEINNERSVQVRIKSITFEEQSATAVYLYD